MGRMCAMIGCPNSVHKIDKWYTQLCEKHGLKFRSCTCHPPFQLLPFPSEDKDPDGRSRWIRLVKRKTASGSKWQPKAHDRICSEHFKNGEPTKEWPDPTEKLGYQLAPFQSSSQSPRNPPRERTAHIPKKRARFRGKLEDTESTPETFPHENSEEGPLPTDFSPSIEDLRPEEPKRYKPYSRLDLNNCSKHATFCRRCSERQSVIDELKKENRELKKIINLSKGDSETFATSIVTQKDKSELCYPPAPCYPPASFTMESPAISTMREINEEMLDEEPQTSEREVYPLAPFTMESQATSPMREIMEEELDEEPQTSEREGYPSAPFTMESQATSPMREIKEEELDEEPQTSEREGYPQAPFTMESQAISPMREIKEEELDEEPQTSEREGYQIVYIKQELNDEDTWQDDGAQMQIHVPVKTESSSESDGNPTFQECNQDSGSQLSEEDGEQDDRGGLNEEGWSTASSVIEKQSRTQIIVREKKVCLAKKLQFVEDSSHRSRVKYNRIKGIFRKAHQLAELTKSEVFLFLRDELSKTTYWGTSDALQLFQPTLDTSIVKGGKRVRSVKFVTPSKPSEDPRGAIPSNLEAPDSDPDLHSCSTNEPTSQIPPTARQSMYELIAQEQESIFSRGSPSQTTTRIPQVNAKEKKVFVAKKLQAVEDSRRRCKARWNRVQSLFRKAHQLAELTRCQAFLYVKDEFSKTIYWGTSYAFQLFQSKIDLLVVKGGKRVWSVNFVAPSRPEQSRGAVPCEALDIDRHLEGCLGSGTPSEELVPSSTWESSQGSTKRSTPELTPSRAGQKSTPQKGTPSKTKIPQITIKEKKVIVDKRLQFLENQRLRCKAKSNRVTGILKKGHQLAEITNCHVFIHVKDEFSKTTYWGTKDALQLFQPTIDSAIKKGGKRVRSVKFVAPSKASESSQGTSPTNGEAPD